MSRDQWVMVRLKALIQDMGRMSNIYDSLMINKCSCVFFLNFMKSRVGVSEKYRALIGRECLNPRSASDIPRVREFCFLKYQEWEDFISK